MPGFHDAECPGCGQKIGWHGEMKGRPKCSRCGYRMLDAELAADSAEIESFREFLGKRKRKEEFTDQDKAYLRGESCS